MNYWVDSMTLWAEQGFGWMTRGRHAGDAHLAIHDARVAVAPQTLVITSAAFEQDGTIPLRHAGNRVGNNISPPLAWSELPAGTVELALILEDPDAPLPRPYIHALAWGIKPRRPLAEGELPIKIQRSDGNTNRKLRAGMVLGKNSAGDALYAGPRALPFHGPHRYAFQFIALSSPVTLSSGANRETLLKAMSGSVLAKGRLDGIFERN